VRAEGAGRGGMLQQANALRRPAPSPRSDASAGQSSAGCQRPTPAGNSLTDRRATMSANLTRPLVPPPLAIGNPLIIRHLPSLYERRLIFAQSLLCLIGTIWHTGPGGLFAWLIDRRNRGRHPTTHPRPPRSRPPTFQTRFPLPSHTTHAFPTRHPLLHIHCVLSLCLPLCSSI
jgi:hypothetical protein